MAAEAAPSLHAKKPLTLPHYDVLLERARVGNYLRRVFTLAMECMDEGTTFCSYESNLNRGGLAHMNIDVDPIIHAEYIRHLLHGELYDEIPSPGAKRARSHFGCRKVARLKRASMHTYERQEQERITLRAATCQESMRKQSPQPTESGSAMATDDEPEINAGDADVTMPLAPSATVSPGHAFVVVLTLDIQIRVPSLADQGAEMFAVTHLNGDLGNNAFPDRSIGGQNASIISNTESMFVYGISTQPPVLSAISDSRTDNISADQRDPY
ncbi:hypothetical protein EDB19DRAFT_2023239 [Suillus lakei]|nr:hypothetical protein EDB19DRAFT_2023239 [Suillus lakei]